MNVLTAIFIKPINFIFNLLGRKFSEINNIIKDDKKDRSHRQEVLSLKRRMYKNNNELN